jgi:hypothetical protein
MSDNGHNSYYSYDHQYGFIKARWGYFLSYPLWAFYSLANRIANKRRIKTYAIGGSWTSWGAVNPNKRKPNKWNVIFDFLQKLNSWHRIMLHCFLQRYGR